MTNTIAIEQLQQQNNINDSTDNQSSLYNDVDIQNGLVEMKEEFPIILQELYNNSWLTSMQYNTALQLINNDSITMLSAYVEYLYDNNIINLIERILRRILHNQSNMPLLYTFSDPQTATLLQQHIDILYNNNRITSLQYQYLQSLVYNLNVVCEAAVAEYVNSNKTQQDIDEFYDTLIRLSLQYERMSEYIDLTYNELTQPAEQYIQELYKTNLLYRWGSIITKQWQYNEYISSADCLYLLQLLDSESNVGNTDAVDVLYAAIDDYMEQTAIIKQQSGVATSSTTNNRISTAQHNQQLLRKLHNELDDTLIRLSKRWRLDCSTQQRYALRQINIKTELLHSEQEILEELIYMNDYDTIQSSCIVNIDNLIQKIDTVMQVDYNHAMYNIQLIFDTYSTQLNNSTTQAGKQYIQLLIEQYDGTLLSIGSLYNELSYNELCDSIIRLSNRWRVQIDCVSQQLLVLLNHLIDNQHIPYNFAETLELCIYKQDNTLMNAFKEFTQSQQYNDNHNDNSNDKNSGSVNSNSKINININDSSSNETSHSDAAWDIFWSIICEVLAKNHNGIEQL